jgi:hypothetical protein
VIYPKISHFGGPKHISIPALPGLGPVKKTSHTWYIVGLLNLASGFKDKEDKANMVFFAILTVRVPVL